MELNAILTEMKQLKVYAEEDVNSGPIETLSGRRGRKNQAIERLKYLKREYTKQLRKTAIFVISSGAGRDELGKLASESGEAFAVDAEEFYNDLVGRVPASLYLGKESISSVFDVLGRHLEDKMNELEATEYNQLIYKSPYARKISTTDEFKSLVRQAINQQIGAEIVGVQAAATVTNAAIDAKSVPLNPIILLNTRDEQLALDLLKDLGKLNGKVFLILSVKGSKALKAVNGSIVLKEVTPEVVSETLTQIRDSLN